MINTLFSQQFSYPKISFNRCSFALKAERRGLSADHSALCGTDRTGLEQVSNGSSGSQPSCTLDSPGKLLRTPMSKHLLTSIKSKSLGVVLGYCYALQYPPGDPHVPPGFLSLIQAVNFRGTGHKLRSRIDGSLSACPTCPFWLLRAKIPCSVPTLGSFCFGVLLFTWWWW